MVLKICKVCKREKDADADFYGAHFGSCKVCVREKSKPGHDKERKKREAAREARKERGITAEVQCPWCETACVGGPGLLKHFQEAHTIQEGRYKGQCLGLDLVECRICGRQRKGQLIDHLQRTHNLTSGAYLSLHPKGMVYVMKARELERGNVRWTVPQKHRRERVKADKSSAVKEEPRRCPVCDTWHKSLAAHFARQHPDLERIPVFESYRVNEKETSLEEVLLGSILSLRQPIDVRGDWREGEARIYFVQAGGAARPDQNRILRLDGDTAGLDSSGMPGTTARFGDTAGNPRR